MLYPVFSWLKLITGIIELIVGTITLLKVKQGSNSSFANILLAFVLLYGLNGISYFIIFSEEYEIMGTQKPNFFAIYLTRYWFFILSI